MIFLRNEKGFISMTEIVCIYGAGPGKDAIARLLKEELEKSEKRVLITYFAAPLRQICRNWFGWNGQNDDAGRSTLQYVGTEIVRAKRPDFWVDYTMGLLSIMGDEWDFVIIPDCRHANELDLERYGFQSRYIRVDGRYSMEGPLSKIAPDFTITNESVSEQLRADIVAVAQGLL